MNFADLGHVEDDDDDDDERFFETYNRLSAVMPHDMAGSSSSEDDEDFDECRISFASSSVSSVVGRQEDFNVDYNMWMSSPGSISERRNRLFQGLGLGIGNNSNGNGNGNWIASFKHRGAGATKENVKDSVAASRSVPPPNQINGKVTHKQEEISVMRSSLPILLLKSRSDCDIEALSIEKRRKQDLLGSISKQRLTRTSSLIISSDRANLYLDAATVRSSPKSGNEKGNGEHGTRCLAPALSNGCGAVFVIKNLDTGKEFVVKEYGEDGMWNRLSDIQTGKQFTMEEFEKSVGYSPVVKELMCRQNVRGSNVDNDKKILGGNSYLSKSLRVSKRRGAALLKNIKEVAHSMSLRLDKENNVSSTPLAHDPKEKKNSGSEWVKVRQTGKPYKELSALHLCQEIQAHEGAIWTMKFSLDGKYLASAGEDKTIHVWEAQECEILSTADGNLTPIHPSMGGGGSPDRPAIGDVSPMPSEKKRKGKGSASKRGNPIPDYVHVPETVLLLSEKPVCSFQGHLDDVLDLSWSRSELLLSSSMDKTVRLWDMESKTCLKLFAHNDYVTCIHFNPMDDNYFISGSLDAKVRIWSIPDRQVVDWTDLHEMVTAACYTPDGQGAMIGSHKGSCWMYSTEDGKLSQLHQMEIQDKKKGGKKITGFQFSPVNPTEHIVTSADSRIRILDGTGITHKFRGFRNTSSQISAAFSLDGKHIISASEDSQVYVWKCEEQRQSTTGKSRTIINTQSHEHFPCRDVSVAIPWPGTVKGEPPPLPVNSKKNTKRSGAAASQPGYDSVSPSKDDSPRVNNKKMLPPLPKKKSNVEKSIEEDLAQVARTGSGISCNSNSSISPPSITDHCTPSFSNSSSTKNSDLHSYSIRSDESSPSMSNSSSIKAGDLPSTRAIDSPSMSNSPSTRATDSPSKSAASTRSMSSSIKPGDSPLLTAANDSSPSWSSSWSWLDVIGNIGNQNVQASAWGLVIVTATIGGQIRVYQNFGLPRRGVR
ncbi:hypothetical protein ACFE04_002077 [Oxalis oulophora]